MKKLYYSLKHRLDLYKKNSKFEVSLPFYKKILYLNRGFLSEKYYLYELYKNSYRNYLSDYHMAQARWINDPFTEILTNKYIFSNVVGKKIRVPDIYGLIINGNYYAEKYSWNELLNLNQFVVKPVDGGGGKGVLIIKTENNEFVINYKEKIKKTDFFTKIKNFNNYIVSEYIIPGEFSQSLYPMSVNTMRILTIIDPQTNIPFIARASQRIGVRTSMPQDNFSKGGLSANIDLETGELSDVTTHPFNSKHERFDKHPETGITIKGLKIPNWPQIKNQMLSLVKQLPMLKVVGWDVVLADNGICIIEGNHHPDPDVLQCHNPLLTDERIYRFYKYYGIV